MASYFSRTFPRQHVWALLRIFDNETYRDDFVSGEIRVNTLGAYRRLEQSEAARRDTMEGITATFPPSRIRITVGGHEIQSKNLVAPVVFHPPGIDAWNVCSFVALHWQADRPIEEEDLPEVSARIRLANENRRFGEHVAVILDARHFLDEIVRRTALMGLEARYGLVQYYDESTVQGFVPATRVGFFKRRSVYADQKEFRIVVERDGPDEEVLWIDISDIAEFALATTTQEFNESVRISFNDDLRS